MSDLFNYFDYKTNYSRHEIESMKEIITCQKVVVIKNVWPIEYIEKIKNYLKSVGGNTIPNYNNIAPQSPNFHRLNINDNRAYVGGCFQQFNFFPWNQDYFSLFQNAQKIFNLKNRLSGLNENSFLFENGEVDENFTARICFQFYPAGEGFMNKHSDPIGPHQFALPNLVMSKKGDDFLTGGTYFEKDSERFYHEDFCDVGDIIFFDASLPHGVQTVDAGSSSDWLQYKGRWMGLFSINKFSSSAKISNSQELET
jgi:hypothetical protein